MSLQVGTSADDLIRSAIKRVAVGPDRGRDISREEAREIGLLILAGDIDPVQAAVFLIALRMKRESKDEYIGLLDALQSSVYPRTANVDQLFCLADPFDGFSRTVTVTPFIAPALAACGLPALMHGVQSIGPKYGVTAQQVYQLAGIDTAMPQTTAVSALDHAGWCFLDQAQYAPQINALRDLRHLMVKRTAITTVERLLTPLRGKHSTHMVLGYVHRAYPEIYANLAKHAGYSSILMFKGVEGGLAPAISKPLTRYLVQSTDDSDLQRCKQVFEPMPGFSRGDAVPKTRSGELLTAQLCLQQGLRVLAGEPGLARDSLSLATAHILHAYGLANSFPAAVVKVQNSLDNGSVKAHFDMLKQRC